MKKFVLFWIFLSLLLFIRTEALEGYYKTIFMDGGKGLNGMKNLPVGDYLDLSWELVATEDADYQNNIMVSNKNDDNGVLLYPDGEPRFQVIFTNGGYSIKHGISLGEEGLERVRTFYYRGGSYTGACGGAYISCIDTNVIYQIWPGSIQPCGVAYDVVGGNIPADSPLLKYYDFGNDNYITNIVHHHGGYGSIIPPGTEILLIHDKPGTGLDNNPSCWAYKDNDTTGRIVDMTSHPENEFSGELRDYMAAVISYALDGLAPPSTKVPLTNGEKRVMDKPTKDNDPLHTKIGDRQYHHFPIDLSDGATNLSVTLDGDDTFNLNLYLTRDTFALASLAEFADTSEGADKTISVDTAAPGIWYIGVECATAVVATNTGWSYEYSGQVEVLNGVKYSIKADWDITDIQSMKDIIPGVSEGLAVQAGRKDISICVKGALPYSLSVFTIQGKRCWEPATPQISGKYRWQPESTGMYIVCLKSGKSVETERLVVVER